MSTIRGCILLYRMEKDNEVRKKMNDNILRIKKSLKKTAKTYKYTRKEKYNIMKNLIDELDLEEQKLLKFELERDIESLKRGVWVKDLIVAGFSGISLLLSAISVFVKSTKKSNGNLLNIVWVVCIIDALYFVILGVWIPYTSRSLCFTQCALQILSEVDGLQNGNK